MVVTGFQPVGASATTTRHRAKAQNHLSGLDSLLYLFAVSRLGIVMTTAFTARYTKIPSGYMGQIVEWPEVITEGVDIDDCRVMLQDALKEMILAYVQVGQTIPAI